MTINGIRFINRRNPLYFNPLLSLLILFDNCFMDRADKLVLGIYWGNKLSVITQWCHYVKFRRVGVAYYGSPEVINLRVPLVEWSCWSWPGIYKSSLTQTSKIIMVFHAEIIEVIISNLRPVINNRVIIIGSILLCYAIIFLDLLAGGVLFWAN